MPRYGKEKMDYPKHGPSTAKSGPKKTTTRKKGGKEKK